MSFRKRSIFKQHISLKHLDYLINNNIEHLYIVHFSDSDDIAFVLWKRE